MNAVAVPRLPRRGPVGTYYYWSVCVVVLCVRATGRGIIWRPAADSGTDGRTRKNEAGLRTYVCPTLAHGVWGSV